MDYSAINRGGFGDPDDNDGDGFNRPITPTGHVPITTEPTSPPPFSPTPNTPPLFGADNAPESPEIPSANRPAAGYRPEPQVRSSSKQAGQQQQQQQQQQRPTVQYKLRAKVTGLERTGRKDPILRFDVHTNLPKFRTTQFRDVRRTHTEFTKLANHLVSSNPECLVPAVPPPSTSAGVGTEEDEARVRASIQRWLNYVCGNEVLMRDEEVVYFVEADFGYSPVVRKSQPATGVRRKMLKQFAPPPDDTLELADARPIVKAFYLGTMEGGQKVDKVVKARRGLALALSDLGVKMGSISDPQITTHTGLSAALRKLGKTVQSVGDQAAAQATAEATTLGDAFNYHSSDAFIVKETLTNRQILMRDLLNAQATTRTRLHSADRLKVSSSVRSDKVDEAIQALDEARSTETHLAGKVNRVTSNLLVEQRRWFQRTASDLRASMRDYTLRQIEAERRILATLENVRPDIRNIDASGGLSRLGRESTPAARRTNLAASQGPRGDAWSGVSRSNGPGINRASAANMVLSPGSSVTNGGVGVGGGGSGGIAAEEGKRALKGVEEEADDDDRVDARNAASRLAASTF
ncbi:Vacuolar protein sorting-associated protein 17 [Arthrobotrys musiformis]|uniref:Vacuolar protein sorting-associated protein 17 n=1 Tax=Arthrobotrys musiformis TaxID=47236 RepID=A0AAV9WC51_9PEZI